jgi:hypothetical protein
MLGSLTRLERKYRRLLYGGPIDASSHIFFTSGGTTFSVAKMTDLAFRDRSCLYAEGSNCTAPGGQYFQAGHPSLHAAQCGVPALLICMRCVLCTAVMRASALYGVWRTRTFAKRQA